MNPLQEHAHLFANGKFKVAVKHASGGALWKFDHEVLGYLANTWNKTSCTLIARPIEDMKRSELQDTSKYYTTYENELMISQLESDIENGELLATDQNLLLSIGMYPFDQSHFDDITVKDSRTI